MPVSVDPCEEADRTAVDGVGSPPVDDQRRGVDIQLPAAALAPATSRRELLVKDRKGDLDRDHVYWPPAVSIR